MQLFQGTNVAGRFSDILHCSLRKLSDVEIAQLGANKDQIGTQSVRKGAASYCATMVAGPSVVDVYLRAGWSLGNVPDLHNFTGGGGDRFTGRVVCGLTNTDQTFGTLPPHFEDGFLENTSVDDWTSILPAYRTYPSSFIPALPFLLASLVYHEDWLKKKLCHGHPLFSSLLFSSAAIGKYRGHCHTGIAKSNRSTLVATGIPPHLCMTLQLNTLTTQMELNRRTIVNECNQLPQKLADSLLSKIEGSRAVPITLDTLTNTIGTMLGQLEERIKKDRKPHNTLELVSQPTSSLQLFLRNGKESMVPEGWKLPMNSDIKNIWHLWYFGHRQDRIRPYRYLRCYDFSLRVERVHLSKIKRVITEIGKSARESGVLGEGVEIESLDERQSSDLFDAVLP